MSIKTFQLKQNLFTDILFPVTVLSLNENSLAYDILLAFLTTASNGVIGVSPAYGPRFVLGVLAFSTLSQVLVVQLSGSKTKPKSRKKSKQPTPARTLLQDYILCNPNCRKFAFKMDRLAVSLYIDLDQRITGGVDLLSMSKGDRCSLNAFMTTLGGETSLNRATASTLFNHDERMSAPIEDIALQAWAACRVGTLASMVPRIANQIAKVSMIVTEDLDEKHLSILAKTLRDADRLDALKPVKVKNDIRKEFTYKGGKLQVTSDRFKTKIRSSSNQTIEIETTRNGKRSVVSGRATNVTGRAATISLDRAFSALKIGKISTIGKVDLTSAEGQRANIILKALQRTLPILSSPFVQRIWLPSEVTGWPRSSARPPVSLNFPDRTLNYSQVHAVNAILSDSEADRITVIHGPPGTGKTTVIAAVVKSVMASRSNARTLWLVAQSNVAVKNIAEKLVDVNFLQFKLLVSKDFHLDWHEHLYEQIDRNIIRSDNFVEDTVTISRLLLGCRVILCTLSMLSNDRLALFTRLVPIETVIVDEASQIEVGDYLPMLHRYQKMLQKLVFIGDDKQLAPYGQDDLNDLQSVFEMPHLRDRAVFLDTQYRMPVPIGSFISEHVYDGRLNTVHNITSPRSCRLVDVKNGKETLRNKSWVNEAEVRISMKIARRYIAEGKKFRIITPYDAQRSLLESSLKSAKLPWEDKVFTVDSFQGNEADHVIISLVRTDKIGFLNNMRRTNVMLSRCKKSMIVCSSRVFLEGKASATLMGLLAQRLGRNAWLTSDQVTNGVI